METLDLNNLSVTDIIEEYKLLFELHQQLKEKSEEDAQQIHELKCSLKTAQAAEAYLTQELEQLSTQPQEELPTAADLRVHQELGEIKCKYKDLQVEHETLQLNYDGKVEELSAIKKQLESVTNELQLNANSKADSADESATRLTALEKENAELMQKLDEYVESSVQHTFANAESEKNIAILRDRLACLEENLVCKRNELEENSQILESTQEQLIEANSRIALLTSAPENNDRKGNSLFAEVDDQRQQMKLQLASQKKSFLEMKKFYTESNEEIRRLKRENKAMDTELQACISIFCRADKTYQKTLKDRICQLLLQNDTLERKLDLMQQSLRKLARDNSVLCFDSILDFCKRETDELKAQLHSMHRQKASLEEQLRNTQQEMARWRFEALRSRCVIMDRENLLTENKISFKTMQEMELKIKEAELQAATPRILRTRSKEQLEIAAPAENEAVVLDEAREITEPAKGTPIKVRSDQELLATPTNKAQEDASTSEPNQQSQDSMSDEPVDVLPAKPCRKGTPIRIVKKKSLDNDEIEITLTPAKPKLKGTPVRPKEKRELKGTPIRPKVQQEVLDLTQSPAKPLRKGTPVRERVVSDSNALGNKNTGNVRSILTKQRDLFADEAKKNVQFSAEKPEVHMLTPKQTAARERSKENNKPMSFKPKSTSIIRHIVVSAKKPRPPSDQQ